MFQAIYETKKWEDESERDWTFSTNNSFFSLLLTNSLKASAIKKDSFNQLVEKLDELIADALDDRILFFGNTIKGSFELNYISLMSEPLTFHDSLAIVQRLDIN